MKTAIVYHSFHHENTEKLVQSFLDGIDIIPAKKVGDINLAEYDLVGFASGIYGGRFAAEIDEVIKQHSPELKRVFLVYTSHSDNPKYGKKMKAMLQELDIKVVGIFSCRGYNTFGPFKLVGGTNKGRPDENDLREYREFMEGLVK